MPRNAKIILWGAIILVLTVGAFYFWLGQENFETAENTVQTSDVEEKKIHETITTYFRWYTDSYGSPEYLRHKDEENKCRGNQEADCQAWYQNHPLFQGSLTEAMHDPVTCSKNPLVFKNIPFAIEQVVIDGNIATSELNFPEVRDVKSQIVLVSDNGVWRIKGIVCNL